MDSFAQYDVAARRIRDLPTQSETQRRLQKAIYQKATAFLHLHMLPLQAMPKLKHASPYGHAQRPSSTLGPRPTNGNLAAIRRQADADASSQASVSSSAVSALEAEERALRERLIVLEEQRFFVSEMVADANRRRRFDEVGALAQNLKDLSTEINTLIGQIERLDFAGAYSALSDGKGVFGYRTAGTS